MRRLSLLPAANYGVKTPCRMAKPQPIIESLWTSKIVASLVLRKNERCPKCHSGSIHREMFELKIGHYVILTGKIFSIVEAVENRGFNRSKAANGNTIILTFILTLRF